MCAQNTRVTFLCLWMNKLWCRLPHAVHSSRSVAAMQPCISLKLLHRETQAEKEQKICDATSSKKIVFVVILIKKTC